MKTFSIIRKNKYLLLGLSVSVLIIFIFLYNYKIASMSVEGWSKTVPAYKNSLTFDSDIKETFLNQEVYSTTERYEKLFNYFAFGAINYKSNKEAFIYYPGEISSRGRMVNGLEGFARFFPLVASYIYSNHSETLKFNDQSYNLIEIVKNGLLNGTDSTSTEYWGDVEDKNQRIVEAADIALGLWISKDKIWNSFTPVEQKQIVKWLNQSVHKKIVDNNWNLFPITIVKVLEDFGHSSSDNIVYINTLYNSYKSKHYLGEGWFDDPPKGIDYYNAWSIHYSLFWLDQIDPSFDRDFIRNSHLEFIKFYKFFFSINGFPIMGRSVCYRLAAPAPIVSAALIAPEEMPVGMALRTLDVTWKHFISKDALQDGKLTQGYYEDDLRVLDGYSGAGSCLWSLRSLVTAFYVDKHIQLFKAEENQLPVEQSDFRVKNTTIGWTISGDLSQQKISLQIDKNLENEYHKLIEYSNKNKLKEFLFKRPSRPNNSKALYNNYIYTNRAELLIDN